MFIILYRAGSIRMLLHQILLCLWVVIILFIIHWLLHTFPYIVQDAISSHNLGEWSTATKINLPISHLPLLIHMLLIIGLPNRIMITWLHSHNITYLYLQFTLQSSWLLVICVCIFLFLLYLYMNSLLVSLISMCECACGRRYLFLLV